MFGNFVFRPLMLRKNYDIISCIRATKNYLLLKVLISGSLHHNNAGVDPSQLSRKDPDTAVTRVQGRV